MEQNTRILEVLHCTALHAERTQYSKKEKMTTLHVEYCTWRKTLRSGVWPALYKQEGIVVPVVHAAALPHLHAPLVHWVAVGRLQAAAEPHLQVPASQVSVTPLQVGLHTAKNINRICIISSKCWLRCTHLKFWITTITRTKSWSKLKNSSKLGDAKSAYPTQGTQNEI